ncbi:MAG: DUF4202 domain-containing protein [Methylotenera sp.]
MIVDQTRFDQAIASFDALNKLDPNLEVSDGTEYSKELLYAQRMSAMLNRYAPAASEALQLAARCQHIQRWKIARASYPMTKVGYYQWRTELKSFHADIAREVLTHVGYDEATVVRVCSLVRKTALSTDAEAQVLEDVVVLVFLESYLEQFVAAHSDYDEAKFVDILNKTLKKTSKAARSAILNMIDLPSGLVPLIKGLVDQKNAESD